MSLLGRIAETGVLDGVLATVRGGESAVLVLRGEAGAGKTALLDWAAGTAADMRVARVGGLEQEMDLAFAGLHQLLGPLLDGLGRLPGPRRGALHAAFGLTAGPPPDRFMVGLAALTILTDAAASQPVLCVIDDAQWLDEASAQVLGFAARRLAASRVGMLLAVRDGEEQPTRFKDLPELPVRGLAGLAARELLAAAARGPVDSRVSERIVAETAGNPLGLVEFGGELTAQDRSGAAALTGPLRLGERLEKLYLSRVRALPADAQALLLVLAADQPGDPARVWRAADLLGIRPEVAQLPAVERLVTGRASLQYRHPLMRSVVYHGAPAVARWRVHEALAAVSDPVRDPDRRAWHLAHATAGPDEQAAGELERSADRARDRGGWASSAAFLERCAELTLDPERRAGRLVAAAEARLVTGEAAAARALLGRVAPDPQDPVATARARRLEGGILLASGEPARATSVLLEAAQLIGPYDARMARDIMLEAFAAQLSGRQADGSDDAVKALRSVPDVRQGQATEADLLLDGFDAIAEGRPAEGAGLLRQAIASARVRYPVTDDVPQRFLAFRLAVAGLYDVAVWDQLARQRVAQARDRGATVVVLTGTAFQALGEIAGGRLAAAQDTIADGRALAAATDDRACHAALASAELKVLAWRGDQAGARSFADRLLGAVAVAEDEAHQALAVLELGLGNYQEALRQALAAGAAQPVLSGQSVPDVLIEAAIRCGDRAAAGAALESVAPWWLACQTTWSLGLLARARALLADDEHAEDEYRLSVDYLRQSQVAPQQARSRLLYGEWLRRQRRRRDAREQLRSAYDLFAAMGMDAFARRTQAGLRAVGEYDTARRARTPDTLTPHEAQIARLAAEGATNREIASTLFVSASTVDYHLRKVFRKLGITRRSHLAQVLRAPDETTRP